MAQQNSLPLTLLLLVLLLTTTTTLAKITSLTFIDATTNIPSLPLTPKTYPRSTLPSKLSIRADISNPSSTKEVQFVVNGKLVKRERKAPYAIAGDGRGPNYFEWDLPVGKKIKLVVYQVLKNGRSLSKSVVFTVQDDDGGSGGGGGGDVGGVKKIVWVDAGKDVVFGEIVDGGVYVRKELPESVSVVAEIVEVGRKRNRVRFVVGGKVVKTESYSPYTIAGDKGKDFLPWSLPLGKVELKVEQVVDGKIVGEKVVVFTVKDGGVVPTPTDCSCNSGRRVRKEFGSLSRKEWRNFVKAYKALKDTDDGKSMFEELVRKEALNEIEAYGIQYLPWHREFLFQFECKLQQIDPTVTIPYWDWSIDSADPPLSPLWDLVGGAKKEAPIPKAPFRGWSSSVDVPHKVIRGFNAGESGAFEFPLESAETIRAMAKDGDLIYRDFAGTLEIFASLTNLGVGGETGDMRSKIKTANDPVHIMHHAFVDKVWADWQTLPGKRREYNGFQEDEEVSLKDTAAPWDGTVGDFFKRNKCVNYQQSKRAGVPASVRFTNMMRQEVNVTAIESPAADVNGTETVVSPAPEASGNDTSIPSSPLPEAEINATLAEKAKKIPVLQEALVEADAGEREKLVEAGNARVEAVAERIKKNQALEKAAELFGIPKERVAIAKKVAAKEDPTVQFSEVEDGKAPGE